MSSHKNQPTQPRRRFSIVRELLHLNRKPRPAPSPDSRPGRSIRDVITSKFESDVYDKARMAQALNQKPIYQGTVDKSTIQRRRAANKRARAARRVHRQRAGR